jgi:hypothetical protein
VFIAYAPNALEIPSPGLRFAVHRAKRGWTNLQLLYENYEENLKEELPFIFLKKTQADR